MTEKQLAEIKERVTKATAGPWESDGYGGRVRTKNPDAQNVSSFFGGTHNGVCNLDDGEYIENSNCENDAQFIAHARQDVPELIAEVERLRVAIERIADDCEHAKERYVEESDIDGILKTAREALGIDD